MQIEPTITLGNILTGITVIATLFAATWRLSGRINDMRFKMNLIWKWYAKEHNIDISKDADNE